MSIPYALAVHGGAGTIPRASLNEERERGFHRALRQILQRGESVLADGGSALDALTEAVCALEDDPLFNAGPGGANGCAWGFRTGTGKPPHSSPGLSSGTSTY
jgi:L-asparaginase / beta-aspartyl-peptidase